MAHHVSLDLWIRQNVSGIVLNGGLSRRMGTDKAAILIAGRPLIARSLDVLTELFDETLVVGRPVPGMASSPPGTRHAARGTQPDDRRQTTDDSGPTALSSALCPLSSDSHASRVPRHVPDLIPGAGPLGGIYTGLVAMTRPWGFFVACDMPCLDAAVIRRQLEVVRASGADAVVPCWKEPSPQACTPYLEPLHAAYSQDCLPAVRRQLDSGDRRIRRFFCAVNVFCWDVLAEGISPRAFANVNTKSDLAALLGEEAERRAR